MEYISNRKTNGVSKRLIKTRDFMELHFEPRNFTAKELYYQQRIPFTQKYSNIIEQFDVQNVYFNDML
jgi:hypothetical protein